ncbi:hypothetical protein [Streptomyces sp. NPDC047079]
MARLSTSNATAGALRDPAAERGPEQPRQESSPGRRTTGGS